jgi:ribosomal protein S18 acetylase RimI-like enzyme
MQADPRIPIAIIRPARADDARGIARVHVETWRDAYAGLLPDKHLLRLNQNTHAIAWSRNLSHPDGRRCAMVAVVQDEIAGFVNFGPARENRPKNEGEVFMLYVATDWRERGVGRSLLKAAFGALERTGSNAASVWCLAENTSAIGFYQRLGGKRIAESRQENVGGVLFPVIGFLWQLVDC